MAHARDLIEPHILDVADFPTPGVLFRDITPLLGHPGALAASIDAIASVVAAMGADKVAAIEARGFVLGAPVARQLGIGFIPIRKAGKLPRTTLSVHYDLEYGRDSLAVHEDAAAPGERIVIVDDVLATGGTAAAAHELVARTGATVAGLAFLIELAFLEGRLRLPAVAVEAVLTY
jgi:adenine phosphoribosyltransferase